MVNNLYYACIHLHNDTFIDPPPQKKKKKQKQKQNTRRPCLNNNMSNKK